MATRKKNPPTFEAGMKELEELTRRISGGELTLEETMKLYEQGMALSARLEGELRRMEKTIEQIDLNTAEITAFEEKEYGIS